jgi:uncharacterized protein YecE (DUF72 family)
MAMLYAGTSGWAYPAWKPAFYPEKTPQKSFLKYYGTQLNAVEVNYTFRHMASEKSLQNWIADTPKSFKFCVKAHQAITHIRRLKNVEDILRRFVGSVELLERARRLGPVLFQLAPNFKADVALLDEFLAQLPPGLRAAFEFRHESWFADAVFETLRKRRAGLCVAESEERETPDVATADFYYARLRKPEYSPQERKQIAERLAGQLAAGRDVFVFYKHEESPAGALYARELLQAAQAQQAAG